LPAVIGVLRVCARSWFAQRFTPMHLRARQRSLPKNTTGNVVQKVRRILVTFLLKKIDGNAASVILPAMSV
jgi:hypothetical protein